MKVKIIAVGKIKEKYLKDGIAEFKKRLSRFTKVDIIEVKDESVRGMIYHNLDQLRQTINQNGLQLQNLSVSLNGVKLRSLVEQTGRISGGRDNPWNVTNLLVADHQRRKTSRQWGLGFPKRCRLFSPQLS